MEEEAEGGGSFPRSQDKRQETTWGKLQPYENISLKKKT